MYGLNSMKKDGVLLDLMQCNATLPFLETREAKNGNRTKEIRTEEMASSENYR